MASFTQLNFGAIAVALVICRDWQESLKRLAERSRATEAGFGAALKSLHDACMMIELDPEVQAEKKRSCRHPGRRAKEVSRESR